MSDTPSIKRKYQRANILLAIAKDTLREIAGRGKNSTMDRRNARSTLTFIEEMETMPYAKGKRLQ